MQTAVTGTGQLITSFFDWWTGELSQLIPASLRSAFAARSDVLCISFRRGEAELSRVSNDSVESLRIDLSGDDGVARLKPEVDGFIRKHASRRSMIVLAVPPAQALCKTLELPVAAMSDLRELLYFELDRQTPYKPDQVRYDHRVINQDPVTGRMRVEFVVVPNDIIDGYVQTLGEWGLAPAVVTVAEADDPHSPNFDLSSGKRDTAGDGKGRISTIILFLIFLALLAVAVYLPMNAQRQAAEEAELALAEASKAAREASDLREELERSVKSGQFLLERKRAAPMVTAVLADLTRLFPDDTWLFELHVREQEIRARGYSPNAAEILELIERDSGFQDVRFTSPVTRVPGIDRERFDLRFELAREGAS